MGSRSSKVSRYLPFFVLAALALLWGYTWVPSKVGVAYADPFVFSALRTVPAGLLLLGLVALTGRPVRPKGLGLTALLGVLQTSGFMGLTTAALVTGGAGRTAILANTWQFWILLLAWPILGERLRGSQWISVALALGGLVLIVQPWMLKGVIPAVLALTGALSYAGGSIVAKILRRRHQVDNLSLTAWQVLCGSIPLSIVALAAGGGWPEWTGEFVASLLFLIVGASMLASALWLYVLRELPAGMAGLGTMGTPVIGLLASWAQLGETPSLYDAVGMIAILAGMGVLFIRGLKGVGDGRAPAPALDHPADEQTSLEEATGR